jgi:hypothetical protein
MWAERLRVWLRCVSQCEPAMAMVCGRVHPGVRRSLSGDLIGQSVSPDDGAWSHGRHGGLSDLLAHVDCTHDLSNKDGNA